MAGVKESGSGWFAALGTDVPEVQRQAAIREARRMGVTVPDDAEWVQEIARLVEADRPDEAITATRERFDLTGTYRFLAALCVPVDDTDNA